MDLHYNAFISYRHHPLDIQVASGIQRSLEHYRIPKALRAKVKKGIHIFRDKEELPITSNLTDDLTRALLNSDFLIVICSTHTKESIWVRREIETFLKTHSKNRVLTVLVDGEPYEVIPEVLQYDEVTDPVTGQVQRLPIEPLSCDWRSTNRRTRKAELARLAAALLGCGYDELRQRQRQYRMRQIITGFSCALAASLALTAYFVYTSMKIQRANEALQEANIQIQNNYEQALRNQSQYLTQASAQRLEAGDRLTAIALAMEALPDETRNRPYYPAAERALNNALGTYDTKAEVVAVGSFSPGALVQKFVVTDDGGVIYIQDARGQISAWDTKTFQRLSVVDFGKVFFLRMWTTAEGNLLVYTTDRDLFCYSSDGKILWQREACSDFAFLEEKKTILVMEHELSYGTTLRFLEPVTGAESRDSVKLLEDTEMNYEFAQKDYSRGNAITLQSIHYDEAYNNIYSIFLADPESGQVRHLTDCPDVIRCTASTPEGDIVVMFSDGSGHLNGNYMDMETTSAARDLILCYDSQTGQQRWASEGISYVYSGHYLMQVIPGTDQLLCQKDNLFQILDLKTGQVLSQCQAPSGVLAMSVEEQEATCVLTDGSYCHYVYGDDSCYSFQYMESSLTAAQINKGIFTIHSLGTQVTVYRTLAGGDWRIFSGEYDAYAEKKLTHGSLLAVEEYSKVHLFDMEQETLLWYAEKASGDRLLGFSDDGTKLWLMRKNEKLLLCYDTQSGQQTTVSLPEESTGVRLLDSMQLAQDRLYYLLQEDQRETAVCLDLNTMTQIRVELPQRESVDRWDFTQYTAYCLANDTNAWVFRDEGTLYEIDWNLGTVLNRAEAVESFPALAVQADTGLVAAACDHEMLLFHPGGETGSHFTLGERKAGSLCWYGEELLALCDDGTVLRYSKDGTLLSRTELDLFNTFYSNIGAIKDDPQKVTWTFTQDGDLLLDAFSAGNLVDCSEWMSKAFIQNVVAYYAPSDSILANCDGGIGAISCYGTEQLLELAREDLNGFELSQEQRRSYGLDG